MTSIKSTILLAEDNLINQEIAIDMLEVMGYVADVANNGREAVEMCQKKHYDIVLMDCQMPIMDGFNATREIRNDEKTKTFRHYIIALTGNSLLGDREKCLESGMDNFLSKPFSYDQLQKMLAQYLK